MLTIAVFIGRARLARKHKQAAAREAAFYLDTCAGVVASGGAR